MIFNPSFPYRFTHTVVAVYLTTAFTVIGVAAWYLRHGRYVEECARHDRDGRRLLASVLVPPQALLGDVHGLNTLAHQPQKLAAMEGLWETRPGQPAVLFALPDEASREPIAPRSSIPKLASFYLTHDWDGVVKGLKDFRAGRPPAGRAGVLRLPRHGRDVGGHARAHACGRGWLAWRRRALRHRRVPARVRPGRSRRATSR